MNLWRVSGNTIGAMVNPTSLSQAEFEEWCYRYLLAKEAGRSFEADFLEDPTLYPKRLTRSEDLVAVRRAIPDIRPTETVVYAREVFGERRYVARWVPGWSWRDLDWRTETGEPVTIVPAVDTAVEAVRTWRIFLNRFLDHRVVFTLDAEGRRSDGSTRGLLLPAPILLVGATRTGRTGWAGWEPADELLPDPGEWDRILDGLARIPARELRRAGLAPQSVRAWRQGRRPSRRNAEKARQLVAERALAEAGLRRPRSLGCLSPDCPETLSGRQESFCAKHGTYPGARRKAWREAALA